MIPTRMALLVTRVFTIALAAVIVTIEASHAADDCLAGPNAAAPEGSHWYYRVDRATHRECWYLGPEGREVRTHAHQDGSPARSHNATSAQPASQTPTQDKTAEAAGAEPLAAEPVPVEITPGQAKTAEAAEAGPLAAEPVPVEITPGQAKTAEINSTASAIPWSAIPTSNLSIDPTLVSTRGSYAEEQSITNAEDETRPVELSAAQQPSEFPISLAQLSAVFAALLGLVALIAPILFRLSAIRKRAHPKADDQRDKSTRRGTSRRPLKATRPPREPVPDFESSVRQLLHELQRRQKRSRYRTKSWVSPHPLVCHPHTQPSRATNSRC
jgi:hypothetical protein